MHTKKSKGEYVIHTLCENIFNSTELDLHYVSKILATLLVANHQLPVRYPTHFQLGIHPLILDINKIILTQYDDVSS